MPSTGAGLLRYARLKAGLSQSELAERAGVARTMVSAYERDRRQATLPLMLLETDTWLSNPRNRYIIGSERNREVS
jgi:transcriptional regulator with XRE-family HTH domain